MLLQAIVAWGLEAALDRGGRHVRLRPVGPQGTQLHLVRDRFGEKPLYYGWAGRDFVFGSELKALRCHPGFDRADRPAARCRLFAARTYIPAPLIDLPRHVQVAAGHAS